MFQLYLPKCRQGKDREVKGAILCDGFRELYVHSSFKLLVNLKSIHETFAHPCKNRISSFVSSQTLTSSLSKNLRSDPAEGRDEVVVKSSREREEVGVSKLERHACIG